METGSTPTPKSVAGSQTTKSAVFFARLTHPTILAAVFGATVAGVFAVLAALITAHYLNPALFFRRSSQPDQIILLGSGTVYNFLKDHTQIFAELGRSPEVLVLQGGTKTGVTLFSEAYHHGTDEEFIPLLSMAAEALDAKSFVRLRDERFFEFLVGVDALRVTLGAQTREEFQRAFTSLEPCMSLDKKSIASGINASCLVPFVRRAGPDWRSASLSPGFRIYANNPNSGTRELVDSTLAAMSSSPTYWPQDLSGWDLRVQQLADETLPWIAFGTPDDLPRIGEWERAGRAKTLYLLDTNGMVERGLYLYGRLTRVSDTRSGLVSFEMDERVSIFLRQLLADLDASTSDSRLRKDLLDLQRGIFHLFPKDQGRGHLDETFTSDQCLFGYWRSPKMAGQPRYK